MSQLPREDKNNLGFLELLLFFLYFDCLDHFKLVDSFYVFPMPLKSHTICVGPTSASAESPVA